jgi:hypothetical protein
VRPTSEPPLLRRARGLVLRLVRRRALSVAIGVALAAPSAWVEWSGPYGPWADGLALVCGATGAALIWTGLTGARGDWVDR